MRKNAKGENCGFDLCAQTVENIQGMTTLMTDQLALAKKGYEYLIDIFYQALKAAGGITEYQLVEFIQQKVGFGNNKRLEDRI